MLLEELQRLASNQIGVNMMFIVSCDYWLDTIEPQCIVTDEDIYFVGKDITWISFEYCDIY